MKIDILRPYNKNKTRSEFYYNETIIVAENQNIRLDIFCEGYLTCYLPENKKYLKELYDNDFNFLDWVKYSGEQVSYRLWSQDYTAEDVTELSIHDMFCDNNWFAWIITDLENNEVISECDDVLDTYDDCLVILNKFIKGKLEWE